MTNSTHKDVQDYYGKTLSTNKDLKTDACCLAQAMPARLTAIIKDIHPEVLEKFYGCGSPIPLSLHGKTVLDLGCGTGRDCYMVSKLVGENGHVIGVDMTDEQLDVAKKHQQEQAERFGYKKSNVTFHKGLIEDLKALDIADNSVDVVISNCVLNLSPQKEKVFSEIFRVIKPGGELYFSDVYSDRRIPTELQKDPELLGECLGGALYIEDFRRMLSDLNICDYRVVENSSLAINDAKIKKQLGNIKFYSTTIRAFKLKLEDRCEDYGQVAIYKGSLCTSPAEFVLDQDHVFEAHKPIPVCKNTADILSQSRFSDHFQILGDAGIHFGLFQSAKTLNVESSATNQTEPSLSCC